MFGFQLLNLNTKKLYLTIIQSFFILTTGWCQFQPNTIFQYSVNDGLAQSTVNYLLRDRTGYLWVATCGGLSRFDGYKFKSFRSHPDLKNSISDNYVRWLHEDSYGNIWIGTESGLDKWVVDQGSIQNITKHVHPTEKNWYIPFYSDKEWLFYADGSNGISKISMEDGSIQPLITTHRLACITNVCGMDQQSCWLCAYGERILVRYFPQNNRITYFKIPDGIETVNEIYPFSEQEILLVTDRGLILFNHLTQQSKPIVIRGYYGTGKPEGACRDRDGNWWISYSDDQLLICRNDFSLLHRYDKDMPSSTSLYPSSVSRMVGDLDGNVWIGSDGNGLFRINLQLSKFPLFRFSEENKNQENFIRCFVTTEDGKLLVGTYNNGLFEVEPEHRVIRKIPLEKGDAMSGTTIIVLSRFDEQQILVLSQSGLYLLNPSTGQSRKLSMQSIPVETLQKGASVVCSLSGNRFLLGGNQFMAILHRHDVQISEINTPSPLRISCMTNIGHDTIFVGLIDKGLYIITIKDEKIISAGKPQLPEKYRNVLFRCFFTDRTGRIWAATDFGLMQLSRSGEVLQLFTENNGLASNDLYGILQDSQDELWLSSNNGLIRFNPSTEKPINYRVIDGLQSEEFNSGAFYRDSNSIMYFGGINGFNFFNPEKIQPNPNLPKVVLTDLFILGDKDPSDQKVSNNKLKLKYYQNFLSFEVAALEFSNPKLNEYSFFMKGQDLIWSEAGSRNLVRYNNLQPGSYELWVKASNNDRQWSPEQNLITITITPPFWKTLWFNILVIIFLALIFYLIIRQIFRQRIKKKLEAIRRIREIDALRAKISRDLHDSAGATLTRISMMGELAKIDLQKQIDVTDRLDNITRSSRALVDNFAEIIWATNPRHDNLESLLAYIRTFVSEFTDELPIEVQFREPENLPSIKIKPDIRHNIFLIVKEGVNNTVKHAKAETIILDFQLNLPHFRMLVQDDGVGLPLNGSRKFGNGLNSMRNRAEAIGAILSVESRQGEGTTIIISGTFN